jgi:hypothetical protein
VSGVTRRRACSVWLPAIIVAPLALLFLYTALGRMFAPFNIEWNEGHSAEMALRFARGEPMYPAPESGWVPYIYAPFYHIVWGTIQRLTGDLALSWGRIISFAATLFATLGAGAIVFEHTRRRAPAVLAALLYIAFFRAGGYWFDIARVDSLANALAVWGCWFCLRRDARWGSIAFGCIALFLAAMTKQTMAVCALVAVPIAIWKLRARASAGLIIAGVFCANFLKILVDQGNTHFLHYTFENARAHATNASVLLPGTTTLAEFSRESSGPISFAWNWISQSFKAPSPIWSEVGRHVWLPFLFIFVWLVVAVLRRRLPRGVSHVAILALLSVAGVESYAKFGGYVNNFLPMHLWLAITTALAMHGLARDVPRRFRSAVPLVLALALALQILQPWNMRERGVIDAGLLWNPSDQIPTADDAAAHEEFISWLRDRAREGESVWVVHQQWYGEQTGHPTTWNVDMVRCAEYAYDPVPPGLKAVVASRKYDWLVLDMTDLQYEWLPSGIAAVIRENYNYAGVVPPLSPIARRSALMPMTGAMVRPYALYISKSR